MSSSALAVAETVGENAGEVEGDGERGIGYGGFGDEGPGRGGEGERMAGGVVGGRGGLLNGEDGGRMRRSGREEERHLPNKLILTTL